MGLIPVEFNEASQWLGAILGVLAALVVQGEAQAFFVALFQDFSERHNVKWDVNPLRHIDYWALPVFLLTGWAWGKKRVEEPPYFPQSWIAQSMVPLTAPVANVLLAGILVTIYMVLPFSVVKTAIEINILIGVANFLIPIPPMTLGRALCRPIPLLHQNRLTVEAAGAVLLTAAVVAEYWAGTTYLRSLVEPPTAILARWVLS